ncbi:hypothetical protein [Clostridium beijerinckii]|uniref:hypothetical protein n=1 Tax=Clostridium beijerinckii TaxID=1520 RepID=UPI001361C752|nr:hypothetical protein [Clostridium beijerinckii]MZK49042.1 hypothetical protein [Clostridium beijerinckii]MZK57417.1 hypothetical protein [Clostridium beijerinckii]MZK67628.1 hypothetical protein [Clostridium beijerinckii]MZK72713.1 hypothetical protein [Clostridium beijerinckii]MZK82309.1 hypothetical protein [Clostridium beijerinckii]
MWNIDYDLKKMISPQKEGYEFVKTLKLYIPYKEIGLQILVRREQPLQFFYEIILKLIDCKCNDIDTISRYIGVEKEILNDVIGEMYNWVYINSNILTLTPEGKNALKTLKQIAIEKEDINKIFINAITGKIEELENVFKKPKDDNPCLTETIRISDEFIRMNFNSFNEYYQFRQEEYDNRGLGIKNEIYQIIKKQYERLCYAEKKVFIYRNIRDGSLMYECDNDPDKTYSTTLAKQISNCPGARKILKSPYNIQRYLIHELNENIELKENTKALVDIIKNNEYSSDEVIQQIQKHYFKNRYLLENEYMEIILAINKIKPSEIIISSDCLNKILNHNNIASLHMSLHNCNVTILSYGKEYRIQDIKKKVMSIQSKFRNKIKWTEKDNIKQSDIVIYPYCAINIMYVPINVDKDYIIKEVAQITFDKKIINEIKEKLLKID